MDQIPKITVDRNKSQLEENLKNYRTKALEMGAAKAAIIRADSIPVDDRVTLKCQIPRCFSFGAGAHCPPNTLKPAELREQLQKYEWAVLFTIEAPSEVIVDSKSAERVAAYQKVYKTVSAIESMAFYDGHYFAFGLGAGSCLNIFCGQQESCAAQEGKKCRFPLISRPSMEAVGVDVFGLIAAQGWNIYPIGKGADPNCVPIGTLAGVVIVQ
jgi:predicted metal-binding protein